MLKKVLLPKLVSSPAKAATVFITVIASFRGLRRRIKDTQHRKGGHNFNVPGHKDRKKTRETDHN